MRESFSCAVCGASEWEPIGERRYCMEDAERASAYVRRRLDVLFGVWRPGERSVTLRSLLCRKCGFVTSAPRPDATDIDNKYRFLASAGSDGAGMDIESRTEKRRARRLWKRLRRRLTRPESRILDFGGGDGHLMRPFAAGGHRCFVVDYATRTVPGVERLAATLEEVPAGREFDLIVCSHVIEHVAEPLGVLSRLHELLREGGSIYVEVPFEIWRKAPLHEEPVTHVNFFTTRSLDILLARAGYADVRLRMEAYENLPGSMVRVIAAVGRRRDGVRVAPRFEQAGDETRNLLSPGLRLRLARAMVIPSRIPSSVVDRLRRFLALR